MKFLIVDDDERMILLLDRYLCQYAPCVAARDGASAVELFLRHLDQNDPFAAVFMDVMLPGMDGIETVKKMRAEEKSRGLDGPCAFKLFMVTAKCDLKIVTQAFFKGGADGYLVKPFSFDDLRGLLRDNKLLDSKHDDAAGSASSTGPTPGARCTLSPEADKTRAPKPRHTTSVRK